MGEVDELKSCLQDIVGKENVSDDDFERICYSVGANADAPQEPSVIVRPKSKEELVEIVKTANRLKTPIMVWGGASNVVGVFSKGCIVIDQSGMEKRIDTDEESMTVTATANVTWTELSYELSKKGWMTGPLCNGGVSATIGAGVVLCNNGVRSARLGLMGDQVVCLEVILPNGEILKTGSGAYPGAGNFIRYAWGPDLTGLFICSHGLFGIVTEVTLKIYELPDSKKYIGYDFDTIEKASQAMYDIQKKGLKALEWMLMVTGGFPISEDTTLTVMMSLLGTREEVDYADKVIEEICMGEGRVSDILQAIKDTRDLVELSGPQTRMFGENMMLMPLCSCIPTLRLPKLARIYGEVVTELEAEKYDIFASLTAFGCDTTVVASPILYYNQSSEQSRRKCVELAHKIVERLADEVGFAPHYAGRTKTTSKVYQKLGSYYELVKLLKKAIDPNNIMNPEGLFLSGYEEEE